MFFFINSTYIIFAIISELTLELIIQFLGSLSVMCCKGLGLCIRETFSGNRALLTYPFLLFVASLIMCLTVQVITVHFFNFV